jgi:hypothetical protein
MPHRRRSGPLPPDRGRPTPRRSPLPTFRQPALAAQVSSISWSRLDSPCAPPKVGSPAHVEVTIPMDDPLRFVVGAVVHGQPGHPTHVSESVAAPGPRAARDEVVRRLQARYEVSGDQVEINYISLAARQDWPDQA